MAFLYSCKDKPTSKVETSNKGSNDSTQFFQVSQYIQSQINEVNKTPYFIYKLEVSGNNKDSLALDNNRFNELAKQFLQPDINDPSIKKYYTESVFFDETTKTFTISYTATNKELPVQNIEVLLLEDGKTVKRIFIRKFYNYTDSSAIEQLSWKPNASFQVMRLLQTSGKNETSRQTTVVWE
jgi:hypothetical protein